MTPLWGLIGLAGLGLTASWLDLVQRRLPNWLCAIGLIAGLGLAVSTGGPGALGWHGLHAATALLGGMALFAAGVIGGGDAKYYAALASWFPIGLGLHLFVAVTMAGAGVVLCWIIYRKLQGKPVLARNTSASEGLPYGVAISVGALLLAVSPHIAT